MAELIREAALEGVRDELPHSLAVVIEEVRSARAVRRRIR
jgi:GTP-binding protein Era